MAQYSPTDDEADEWEEGSLPAAPKIPFFTPQDFVDVVPHSQSQENNDPSSRHRGYAQNNDQFGPQTKGRPGRPYGRGTAFTSDRERRPYRPEIGGIPSHARGIGRRQAFDSDGTVENAAYASCSRGEPAGGQYAFSRNWRQLLSDLHGDQTHTWARGELDRLSRQTGTFISTPIDDDSVALIWGDKTQIAYVRASLEEFEVSIRNQLNEKRKNVGKWTKITALDGRKEHREEREAKIDELVSRHEKLKVNGNYAFEFWLLWPSQDLDFEQISSSTLQGLRKNFWCAIDYEPATSFVRVMANEERNLMKVVQRIINLAKEMIAELNNVIKANLVQPPSIAAYESIVRLEGTAPMPVTPMLEGRNLSVVDPENAEHLLRNSRRSNRRKIGKAVEKCLKGLRVSEKHVQMRVNFGKLAFKQYQLPLDGGKHYRFGDFCEMVENDRTVLELQGMLCGSDTDAIVSRCANHPMFVNSTESYSVHVDFKEANKPTTLRLEKHFSVSLNGREVFNTGHSWLEFPSGSKGTLLEVSMLELEYLDWQMTMNEASFFATAENSQQYDSFQTNVTFKPTPDGMKGQPQRRVFFKSNGPKPTLVTELTTITYQLSATNARFELTRKDEYQQTLYGTAAGPPVSRLSASYFYPNWDDKLGQYAYLPPGGQVDWQASLSTFFPDSEGEAKQKGMKKFMEEIKEIRRILAGKPADADGAQSASLFTDVPNGVKTVD